MNSLIKVSRIVLLAILLFSLLLSPGEASAANYIVSQANTNGWGFLLETGTTGTGSFVTGPGTPPAGTGSARLTLGGAADGILLGAANYLNTPLANITTLTYAAYRTSGGPVQAVAFQINIDYDITDANTTWQGRLVYEPYNTGTNPSTGVWETWDTLDAGARWWASGSPGNGVCPISSPCSWSDVLTNFPNAGIHPTQGAVLFKAGSGWAGFDGNVDNFTIGILGTDDNYDFENIAPANVYVDDDWTGTVPGEDPDGAGPATVYGGDAFDNIQDGATAVATSGTVNVFAGTYPENVTVTKSMTIDGTGNGTNPLVDTILDGSSLGSTTSGIQLLANVINVTIQDLTIQDYTLSSTNYGGIAGAGSNNNFTAQNLRVSNNSGGRGGIYLNGPVDTVLIDNVIAHNNANRGIVIWNGFKTNITITNNDVQSTNCCGIELQDGTASGVTISGNTVVSNGDSGLSAIGLTSGAGPNVISGNTVTNNGRFGIEIKNPNGTGAAAGDGSIVIENNNVSFTASPAMNNRDHAGIAVFRRSFISGNPTGYVDVPTGVVIQNNTVTGYQQQNPGATTSEGFGIVVEGLNHTVTGNTVQNNDIGIQEQGGNHPNANYVPNDAGDGDQADGQSPLYFGRGNAPIACGSVIGSNIFGGNGADFRRNVAGFGSGSVTNTDTGEIFCSIQSAIDDADTVNGHTLDISAGTYTESITITKSLTLNGPNVGVPGDSGSRVAEATIIPEAIGFDPTSNCKILAYIAVSGVTLDGLAFDGNNPALTSGETVNGVDVDACEGVSSYEGVGSITIENNVISNLTYAGMDLYNYLNGGAATSDNYIRFNRLNNIGNTNYPFGIGTLIYNNFYADISQNVYDMVRVGIQTGNFNNANPGATGQISQNEINVWRLGIFHNLWYSNADLISVDNNTINAIDYPGQPNWSGMLISSWQNTANTTIVDNIINVGSISQLASGYNVWNTPTTADLTISGGTVDGADYGVFVNNYDGYSSNAGNTSIIVDGLNVSNAALAGVYVKDNPLNSNGATVNAVVQNSAIQNSLDTAVTVEGPDASGTFKGLTIDTTVNVFNLTDGSLLAYANNITNFTDGGLTTAAGTFEARRNWWDSHFTQPSGVDTDSWDHRLGAAVQSWSEGDGSTTLTDLGNGGTAQLSGGTGTAVIISHGRPATVPEAPFGNGVGGYYDQMCSDFYDMFLLTGAGGTWTASVPLDATPGCAVTLANEVIFWIPWGTDYSIECAPASNGACWDSIDPLDVVINGGNLDVQNLTYTELSGTPIVAGNDTQTDPTAITLSILNTRQSQSAWVLLFAALALVAASVLVLLTHRKQN